MHSHSIESWQHDHVFGQDQPQEGERRTKWVIALTATTMVVEIICGIMFGSMALLADGLHMASHTAALGIAAFAYSYARRNAANPKFSFGTGKVAFKTQNITNLCPAPAIDRLVIIANTAQIIALSG